MIIKRLNGSFLRLSVVYLIAKMNEHVKSTQKNLGVFFLAYYLDLHHQSVGVHDFQFTTYFSPVADRHCPFFAISKVPDIVPSSAPGNLEIRFSACSIYDSMNLVILWHS